MTEKEALLAKIKQIAENHRRIAESYTEIAANAQKLVQYTTLSTTTSFLTIPEGVYHLPDWAYFATSSGTYKLFSVTIPKTLKSAGRSCFSKQSNISATQSYTVILNIPTLDMWLTGALKAVVPWFKCEKRFDGKILVSIAAEDTKGVTSLKSHVFSYCKSLQSADFPEVVSAGTYALAFTDDLKYVNLPKLETVAGYLFYISGIEEIELPAASTIGAYAFYSCAELRNVSMPNVSVINNYAFRGCNFERLMLPSGLQTLNSYAFSYNSKLRGVLFKGKPSTLNSTAFNSDATVNTVCVPWSPDEIRYAPWGMLTATIYYNHPTNYGFYLKDYYNDSDDWITNGELVIYGEGATLDFAANADQTWYDLRTGNSIYGLIVEEGITRLGSRSLAFCKTLKDVRLPSTLKEIGAMAFNSCELLYEIDVPQSVTLIENGAFQRVPLTEITLPGAEIWKQAFNECAYLETVTFTGIPSNIENNAFYGCEALRYIGFTGGDMEAENGNFFKNYPFGASEELGIGVTRVGTYPMFWTYGDGTLRIEGNAIPAYEYSTTNKQDWRWLSWRPKKVSVRLRDFIGERAFMGMTGISEIILEEGLKNIANLAFNGCSGIRTLTLPASMSGRRTGLHGATFQNCTGLETVTFKGTPETISSTAFTGCAGIKDIYVPWADGEIAGAPWGATSANVHYSTI